MTTMANVVCPACGGTGSTADERYGCTFCMTQGHIRVNRTVGGDIPEGMTEWVDKTFGEVPNNPLIYRSEANARP